MSKGSSDRPPGSRRARDENDGSTFRANPAPKRPKPVDPYEDVGDGQTPPEAQAPPPERPRSTTRPSGSKKKRPIPEESAPPTWKAMGEGLVIGKVRAGELATFCRQFGVYLDSGVGILKALASLREQVAGTAMGPVVERMGRAIKRGSTLADAAAAEPQAFDKMALSMLRVAEARGGMPETLKSLASHYESRQRFWRQARSAMIYPAVVITVTLAVGGLLTIFVLPKLVEILEDVVRGKGIDLPGPTKLLMAISGFVKVAGWWLIPLLFLGCIVGIPYAYRKTAAKRWMDEAIVRLPGLGGLVQLIDQGRFARTLSDLLDAGVDIDTSLGLSSDVLQFEPYRRAVERARAEVVHGSELGPALKRSQKFPPDLLAFVETGEETGQLPENLSRVADDYQERAEGLIKNIGSVIQPLLMIVIGGIVGFVVIAFLMAYVAVLTSLMAG